MNNGEVYFNNNVVFDGGNINMVKKKNKLPWIIVGIVGVLLLAGIIFLLIRLFPKKAVVSILVAPESAEIEIDGEIYKNGVYSLPVGEHFVEISADGFSNSSFSFDVEADEANEIFEYLDEETAVYSDRDYEILSLIADDDSAVAKLRARAKAKTLFTLLPYSDSENRVYLTDQTSNPACKTSELCLGVTNLGSLSESGAYDVVRSLGYDPNDYTVFYELGTNNYYKETD